MKFNVLDLAGTHLFKLISSMLSSHREELPVDSLDLQEVDVELRVNGVVLDLNRVASLLAQTWGRETTFLDQATPTTASTQVVDAALLETLNKAKEFLVQTDRIIGEVSAAETNAEARVLGVALSLLTENFVRAYGEGVRTGTERVAGSGANAQQLRTSLSTLYDRLSRDIARLQRR